MTPPPAALAPSVALERLIERLREPRTMSQFMGTHDMALALLRERATLADELATLRASLAQRGEAECLGFVHECVWTDGTSRKLHQREPSMLGPQPGLTSERIVRAYTHPAAVDAAMVERALVERAQREDGAQWPDAYSDDEQQMERANMRADIAAALQTGGPGAYCRACQSVGMSNCGYFDDCSGATCITCHRPFNTPAALQPAATSEESP